MKKAILLLAFTVSAFCVSAQYGHIRVIGPTVLESGSIEFYDGADLYTTGCYDNARAIWVVSIGIVPTGTTTNFLKTVQVEFANATIDALTPISGTSTQKIKT